MQNIYDDDGERDYLSELEEYAFTHSQDARLLWFRIPHRTTEFTNKLIDDPKTDRAIIALIFWNLQPDFYIKNPDAFNEHTEISRILKNLARGYYQACDLYVDRYEIAHGVHGYLRACEENPDIARPFSLPKSILGPFDGRKALLQQETHSDTVMRLNEIRDNADVYIPGSHDEWWKEEVKGGNLWIKDHLELPKSNAGQISNVEFMEANEYLQTVYGTTEAYAEARRWAHAASDYLGKPRDNETRREELRYALREMFKVLWKSAIWLFLFAVVVIGGAFVLRRINFGVWL